jgi:deoxyribodipyrimidine photo-lyase
MNHLRICNLNNIPVTNAPIVYWMSRDQRVQDNWALIHAQQLAMERKVPLCVVFTLSDSFLGATLRQYGFMLRGLAQVAVRLNGLKIPFLLLRGEPGYSVCRFVQQYPVGALVMDFDPLSIKRRWRETVTERAGVACIEVDSHNIVPCRVASPKQEFGAYTLRPKLNRLLPGFLDPFPTLEQHPFAWQELPLSDFPVETGINALLGSLNLDSRPGEITAVTPGESAAHRRLLGFIENGLEGYDTLRNDPSAAGQSALSPYLHFGQIAPQRVALEVSRAAGWTTSGAAFLEELIVRRELSDNFCWYNQHYAVVAGFPEWAQKSIGLHRDDRREYLYSQEQLESAATHDRLWNATQQELVTTGTMHGYLRMYWAKKILEWTESVEAALEIAIYLNDRYQLDGRDPNGYAGIAWSIGGLHDRAWGERPLFGKIRYMNENGCRRKFDVERYILKQSVQ